MGTGHDSEIPASFRDSLESARKELPHDASGGSDLPLINSTLCRKLAREFGLRLRQVEREALSLGIVPDRYLKNMQAVSLQEQRLLLESRVGLIGLGGLGGWILEILARMGVGRIRAADGDRFAESNLNRQLLSSHEALGRFKTEEARARLERINPAVELDMRPEYLDTEGFIHFLRQERLIVDALGGLENRLQLKEAAASCRVPLITGALAGEIGYVSTVYPGERGPFELWSGGTGAEETLGCPPFVVAAVASVQCTEAVHILCGREPLLRGRMAVLDCASLHWETFTL